MNFPSADFLINRQRCRQWQPLITQQFRLRHLYQVMAFNLRSDIPGYFYYFTLHSTTMCAPFYTSESISNPNPKWAELNLFDVPNASSSCLVIRVWQKIEGNSDKIILTWGLHLSGLVYLGSKISDIQPAYFKQNSVIFGIHGGYYTSLDVIRNDTTKPAPFLSNLNVLETGNDKRAMYRRIAVKSNRNEIQNSYSVEKLQRIQRLQVEIKKKRLEVQNIQEKINAFNGGNDVEKEPESPVQSSIRYAPQLLTMTSLNKMLQEKPTKLQKQEMLRLSKEIELRKFKTKLLHQEKDKKTVTIRQLKQKHARIVEENEERNSDLMENYHKLSRSAEKLKDYKKDVMHHREVYLHLNQQLHQRRKQLLQELLFIYPIEKIKDDMYTIYNIHLPNSDILSDSADVGISVALGYVSHILIMCSTFLQVPLRYPVTHFGSRSFITDNIIPLPEKERDFPLFTRGKDKAQFTYAVYLLNKNIAQLRWLVLMNTGDLKATLPNLLTFLQGQKDGVATKNREIPRKEVYTLSPPSSQVGFGTTISSTATIISDPILDRVRREMTRSYSPQTMKIVNECYGRGLSKILAIPEAFLNKQISSDSLRNYIASGKNELPITFEASIKITNGKEVLSNCGEQNVEEATDALDLKSNGAALEKSKPILIHTENDNRQQRLSRSADYDENPMKNTLSFEPGSDPFSHGFDGVDKLPKLKDAPLTVRTTALLTTKSFNLVKPKPG